MADQGRRGIQEMNQNELWDELYTRNSVSWRGNTIVPIPNSGKALDLGCGNGKTASSLIDKGYDVTGVDFSAVAVEFCRKKFPESEFILSSVCDIPLYEKFDYITAVHLIENLDDDEVDSMIGEIHRLLKEDGFLFVRSFTPDDMRSEKRRDADIRYIFRTKEQLESLFNGFEIISSQLVEDRTRFGTKRSRVEMLMKA